MKKEKRQQYRDLINLTSYGLCSFCKYAEFSGSCCNAGLECNHPLPAVSDIQNDNNGAWAGEDCWGFRPDESFEEIGKFVGICLEGNMPHYSNTYGELIAIIPSERDKEYL